jgi:hypothetical protein
MIHVFPAVGALMSNGGMGGPRPKGTPRSGNVAQGDRTMWKKKLSSRSGLLSACLAVAATVTGCATQPAEPVISVVLAGGTVFAGEDREGFVADVWIRGDRIAGIGDASSVRAEVRLDVSGLAVAPGFIDLHSHAIRDNPERSGIFRWPDAENEVRQGVTTVVGGPDGWSPLPLEETFVELEAHPAAVNFGAFVGARKGGRPRRPPANGGRAGTHARAGGPGDAPGRLRPVFRPGLHARQLR